MEINGKVVIITGASQGIGLATARLFARHGARLALVARSFGVLEEIARELPDAIAISTDMRDEQAVRAMVKRVLDHFGRIDVLINNAGRAMHVTVETADPEKYRELLELNVVSVLIAMQEVVPIMRRQGGGVIINISSGLSKRIVPNVGPYASTKYALNALTLTARAELARDNIRVGLVIPGLTATGFHQNAISYDMKFDRPSISPDTAEHVAEKILEAVETEEAEVYADSTRPKV